MATAYNATNYVNSQAVTDRGGGSDITVPFTFATSTLSTPHLFVLNDTINLVKLPRGAVITDYLINMPDIDSGTSATFDLGLSVKASSTQAFIAASTVGQSLGSVTPQLTLIGTSLSAPATTIAQALPYAELTADDILLFTAHAAGAGAGAGGTINGWVRYFMRSTVFKHVSTD